MRFRLLGSALVLSAAIAASACSSSDTATDQAADAASGATSAVGSAGDSASGDGASDTEPTDAPVGELLLTSEEVAPWEVMDLGPDATGQAAERIAVPDGSDIQTDPPECADAADINATLKEDMSEGGLAALAGTGADGETMVTVQVLRTSVPLDAYEENWEMCTNASFSSENLGMSGTSRAIPGFEVDGAPDTIGRATTVDVQSAPGAGGPMTTYAYITEVRGVKVVAGAMGALSSDDSGLAPETEEQIVDLMTRQVAKINDAA